MPVLLNVASIKPRSRANGPGVRSVVWVQGCTIGCPGCFNPHTHVHVRKHLFDPVVLAGRLCQIPDTDGISISGGEPFEQAKACAVLAESVRRCGRSVVVFTGFSFRHLRESTGSEIRRFLAAIDLIIAGPYVASLSSGASSWRGSTNQTVHALTDRLALVQGETFAAELTVEVSVDGVTSRATGFPRNQDLEWFDELIRATYSESEPSPAPAGDEGHGGTGSPSKWS